MYGNGESIFYYLTVMNEPVEMPAMPAGDDVREGILKGMCHFKADRQAEGEAARAAARQRLHPAEVIKAQAILEEKYDVGADVWSVTSYGELYRDGHACGPVEHAASGRDAESAVRRRSDARSGAGCVRGGIGLPARYCPTRSIAGCRAQLVSLGTDGFGRSESRADLRNHFEVDARFIVVGTLLR